MDEGAVISVFGRLLRFLEQLENYNIAYDLDHVRETIMVRARLPAGIWEIEFFEDGTIEVEFFERSQGVRGASEAWLKLFIEQNRD